MNQRTIIATVRDIMLIKKPDHLALPTSDSAESFLIDCALDNLAKYAKTTSTTSQMAWNILRCYEFYEEYLVKQCEPLRELIYNNMDHGILHFRPPYPVTVTHSLMRRFWIFNYTLIAILTMLET